jgi:hypothetical protein
MVRFGIIFGEAIHLVEVTIRLILLLPLELRSIEMIVIEP